jgi:fibronectin-binding autotransporter adhesin
VNQASQRAILNWNSFNISANETTRFIQPSASSVALNRINPQQGASQIYGTLSANGKVILVNAAGIHFGPNAMVNVGSIIATTSDISDANFLSGKYIFDVPSAMGGKITNEGTIIAAQHGLVALLGSSVTNTGLIQAKLGSIALGSGDKFTFDFYGDQLINFSVDAATSSGGTVTNSGKLLPDGGSVLVTARQAQGVLDDAINMSGVVQANSVHQKGGEIILDGGAGNVTVSGKLTATSAHHKGGNIKVLGNNILLKSTAVIDASGQLGGGTILLGGNKQGAGSEQNASSNLAEAGSVVKADAITSGNGGNVIVWSNNNTQFLGSISVAGGSESGNGGFIETSGHYLNIAGAKINLSASNGSGGIWLLDPADLTISTGATANPNTFSSTYIADNNSNTSVVNVSDLTTALASGNVVIQTTSGGTGTGLGNITVATGIAWSSANSLTLQSINDIAINAPITTGAAGSVLILNAAGNITQTAIIGGSGDLTFAGAGTATISQLNTYAGSTFINAGTVNATATGNFSTGNMTVASGANLVLNNTILNNAFNLSAGTITAQGGGNSALGGAIVANNLTLNVVTDSDYLYLNGIISGGTLYKNGLGTLVLSNTANSFFDEVNVNSGYLSISQFGTAGSNSQLGTSGRIQLGGNGSQGNLSYTGSAATTDLIVDMYNIGDVGGTINNLSSGTLTMNGIFNVNNHIITFNTAFGDIVVSSPLSVASTIIKEGSHSLMLNVANTYASTVNINNGTVRIGDPSALGVNGSVSVANLATLDLNNFSANIGALSGGASGGTILLGSGTFSFGSNGISTIFNGTISGSGGITKGGGGSTTLNGANSYTGATTINGGVLVLTNADAFGNSGSSQSSSIIVNPTGELDLNFSGSFGNTNAIALKGFGSTGGLALLATNPLVLTNNISLDANTSIGTFSSLTLSGLISGAGNLNIGSSGIITITGTNNYSGGTAINSGTVSINNASSLGGGSVTLGTFGTLALNNNIILPNAFNSANGTITSSSSNELSGDINLIGTSFTLNMPTNTDVLKLSGIISGTGALIETGLGTLQMLGINNSYSGVTSVNSGKLVVAALADSGMNSSIGTFGLLNIGITGAAVLSYTGSDSFANISIIGGGKNLTLQNVGTGALVLTGPVNFGGAMGTIDTATADIEMDNFISLAGMTKIGSGILTLQSNGLNNFASVDINDGALRLGSANVLNDTHAVVIGNTATLDLNDVSTSIGSITGSGAITLGNSSGVVLTLGGSGSATTTFDGSISGAGGVNFNLINGSTFTMTGANSYTGSTTVSAGILTLMNVDGLGAGAMQSSSTQVLYGTTFNLDFSGTFSNTNPITLAGNGAGTSTSGIGALTAIAGSVTLDNPITFISGAGIGNAGGALTLSGLITADTGFTKYGTGALVLNNTNNYTGTTSIQDGVLQAGMNNAFSPNSDVLLANSASVFMDLNNFNNIIQSLAGGGSVGGVVTLGSGALTIAPGNFTVGIYSGDISGTGGVSISNIYQRLGGQNTYSGATNIASNAVLVIGEGGATGTLSNTSSIVNNGSLIFLTTSPISVLANISGSGTLQQSGAGLLQLMGNNTYLGNTSIGNGTIQAGSTTGFSPNSSFYTGSAGNTLDLNGFSNTIFGLGGNGNVLLGSATLTIGNGSANSVTYLGNISGTGGVNIVNNMIQTLGGQNSYSGMTTIGVNAQLIIGSGGTTGTLSNSSSIVNNGSLVFNTTNSISVPANISGPGSLQQDGSGLLQLTGNNTYSGITLIIQGTLQAGSSNAFSTSSAITMSSIQQSILDLNGFNVTLPSLNGGNISGLGSVLLGANTLTLQNMTSNANFAYDGTISGSGGMTLNFPNGTSFFTLRGANTYTGTTMITAGFFQVGGGGSTGSLASASVINNGDFRFFRSGTVIFAGNISGTGTFDTFGSGIIQLSGNNTYSGTTFPVAGTLQAGSSTAFSPNSGFSLGSGATLDLNGYNNTIQVLNGPLVSSVKLGAGTLTIQNNIGGNVSNSAYRGVISGSGGIKVNLTGPNFPFQFLLGENTYTGSTEIVSGNLQVGGGFTVGSLSPSSNIIIDSAGSLAFYKSTAYTIANNISGTGELDLGGAGTTTLSGNNSYGGVTYISGGGTVIVNSSSGFGTSFVNLFDGATLMLSNGVTIANNLSVGGAGYNNAGALSASGGLNYLTGSISMSSDTTFTPVTAADSLYISGIISGPYGVNVNGLGLTYFANPANTYTGQTSINSGTLVASQLSNAGVASSLGTGSLLSTILLGSASSSAQLQYDNLISSFTSAATNRAIQLNGDGSIQTVSGLLTLNGAIDGAKNLTLMGPGAIQLGAAVGSNTVLNSLTVASGMPGLMLSGGLITTLLNQTYNSLNSGVPVTLGANTLLTSTGNGNISIASGAAGNYTLTLAGGSGNNAFSIGGSLSVNNIRITGGSGNQNTMSFANYVTPIAVDLTANYIGTLSNTQQLIGNFSNIQNVVGNNQGKISVSNNSKINSIIVTGPLQGIINDPTNFNGFSRIVVPANTQISFANPSSVQFVNGIPYVNNVPMYFYSNNGTVTTPILFNVTPPSPPVPPSPAPTPDSSFSSQQQSAAVQVITAQSSNNSDKSGDISLSNSIANALSFTTMITQIQHQMDLDSLNINIFDSCS